MDFLDKIYFDNTVRSYLLVAAIIIVVLILRRFLSRYIASLLYLPVKKYSKNIEKSSFITLVITPLEILLVIVISALAIDRLYFPEQLVINVYHVTSKQIVESLVIGLMIIAVSWVILRLIDFFGMVIQYRHELIRTNNQLILFVRDFIKVIVVILAGVMILKFCFNAHIGQLITGLSIVGAALALAAKESLENLIASFIIFSDKPFASGDVVRVNNYQGTVERVGLRSTRIRTAEKTLVVVPNKQMVDSILDNWSMRDLVRNDIRIELSPKTSSEKMLLVISEIKKILEDRKEKVFQPSVFLQEITRFSAVVTGEYFTTSGTTVSEINKLKEDIYLAVKKMMEENEILSPEPIASTGNIGDMPT